MIKLLLIMGFLSGLLLKAQPIEDKQLQESVKKHETGHIDTH